MRILKAKKVKITNEVSQLEQKNELDILVL